MRHVVETSRGAVDNFEKLLSENHLVKAVNLHGSDKQAARCAVGVQAETCGNVIAQHSDLSWYLGGIQAYVQTFVCDTSHKDILFHCLWQKKEH